MEVNSITHSACFYQKCNKNERKINTGGAFSQILQKNMENGAKTVNDGYVSNSRGIESETFTGSYHEKLKQVETLNRQTDWTSMSDVEKVKLLFDRYQEAFPDFNACLSGLYKPYSSYHTEITEHYDKEFDKYLGKTGTAPIQSPVENLYKRAYYGELSDEEIRTVIMDKFSSSNTMESKYLMLRELSLCDLLQKGEGILKESIKMQIFSQVEDANKVMLYGTGMKISQHPRFLDMFTSYAKGIGMGSDYMPNWTEVVATAKDTIYPSVGSSNSTVIVGIKDGIDNFLDEILRRK